MINQKLTGLILHLQAHGEYDRVITVFSYEYGVIRVVAKGVRKIKSQRGFHLDILSHVCMELEQYSGIPYVREVSTLSSYKNLKASGPHFAAGCLISSFILKIVPQGAVQKTLFAMTKKSLDALEKGGQARDVLLVFFLKALRHLGYLPSTMSKEKLRKSLWKSLVQLDPEFTLRARRTLGIFSM